MEGNLRFSRWLLGMIVWVLALALLYGSWPSLIYVQMDTIYSKSDIKPLELLTAWARSTAQVRWTGWTPHTGLVIHPSRDHHTFFLIFDAQVRIGTCSSDIDLKPGSATILPPLNMYTVTIQTARDNCQVFQFGFSIEPGPVGNPWTRLPLPVVVPMTDVTRHHATCKRLVEMAEDLISNDLLHRLHSRLQARPLADMLFTGFLTAGLSARAFGPHGDTSMPPQLNSALQILRAEMSRPELTMESVAGKLGITVRTLHRLFRRNLASSPQQFLAQLRLNHAAYLIESEQGNTVAEIAHRCGYANHSAFSQAFARYFGRPPSRWRTRQGDDASTAK